MFRDTNAQLSISLLFSIILTTSSPAQDASNTIPSFKDVGPAKKKVDGKGYLEQRFKLSKQEADDRLDRQEEAEQLSVMLAEKYPEAFLGLEIQHEPVYQVILSMASDQFDSQIRKEIPSKLRSLVKIRKSRFDVSEVESTRKAIIIALEGLSYEISFDYSRDRFTITAEEGLLSQLKSRIKGNLNALIDFKVGQVARPAQSNASPSDTTTAGWLHYGNRGPEFSCTFAFTARDSSGRQSLLTAQHCQDKEGINEVRKNNQNGKVITFALPTSSAYYKYGYDRGFGRTYDFRLLPAETVSSGPWLWFSNPRTNSYLKAKNDGTPPSGWSNDTISYTNDYLGLPASGGYLAIVGSVSSGTTYGVYNPGHPKGAVRCKSGGTSGFTCGLIVNSSYYSVNEDNIVIDGMVEVSQTSQPVIAASGDSGGPIIDEPRWSATYGRYEAKAAGIMHGATLFNINPVFPAVGERPCDNRYDNVDCSFIFMPLDRVNDFAPVLINVFSGNNTIFVAP